MISEGSHSNIRTIAFYLPQFHTIPENDEWWGKGFTEWTNVKKAKPNYVGHYQPHVPLELGYYDLDDAKVMQKQVDLAKQFNINGFCFYWYWFNGRQVLEKPVDNFLRSEIDFPFCLCWANENWTRTWDGDSKRVLLKQEYNIDNLTGAFFDRILPFIRDPRYIKVNDKPLIVVYRADQVVGLDEIISKWRARALEVGLSGIVVAAVNSFDIYDHKRYGCDMSIEFPPHQFFGPLSHLKKYQIEFLNDECSGFVCDYAHGVYNSLRRSISRYRNNEVVPGFMPSWDNTARRQHSSAMFIGSSPAIFNYWVAKKLGQLARLKSTEQILFINAWNEWGEGCHLEPDTKYGYGYLEAFQAALEGRVLDEVSCKNKLRRVQLYCFVRFFSDKAFRLFKYFCMGNRQLEMALYKIARSIAKSISAISGVKAN